tara:strand:+ start:338 stop:757 length:420 start_codon:yes stop_codon:yes gene_type:complete
MREFIPDVITPEEAEFLVGLTYKRKKNPKIDHPAITKIRGKIDSLVKASWGSPAYTRLERRSCPHKWHKDTGSNNHMLWCRYGCSVLLTDKKEAGFLEYRDGFKLGAAEHFCGLAIHSSDVEHQTVHKGCRITYLAFLA